MGSQFSKKEKDTLGITNSADNLGRYAKNLDGNILKISEGFLEMLSNR
jgi:hypothetical protein